MKFRMSENSLFAILLRSKWWVSALIALLLGAAAFALLPQQVRAVGWLTGLPFAVIAALALRRQWGRPNDAQVARTQQALAGLAWPAFATLLEQHFKYDGFTVERRQAEGLDFVVERRGRRMVVSARRWKSAHTGLEPLRALQAAREAEEATDALYIGLGPLSEPAQQFALQHRLAVWQATLLAQSLHKVPALEAALAQVKTAPPSR